MFLSSMDTGQIAPASARAHAEHLTVIDKSFVVSGIRWFSRLILNEIIVFYKHNFCKTKVLYSFLRS